MTQRPWLDEFAESRGAMARASLQEASLKRDGEQPVGRGTGEMTNQIDTSGLFGTALAEVYLTRIPGVAPSSGASR